MTATEPAAPEKSEFYDYPHVALYPNLELSKEVIAELDAGIRDGVILLCRFGVYTQQSCEGGAGHAYAEPSIDFSGDNAEGLRALAVCIQHALPVRELQRVWKVDDIGIRETYWRITFYEKLDAWKARVEQRTGEYLDARRKARRELGQDENA